MLTERFLGVAASAASHLVPALARRSPITMYPMRTTISEVPFASNGRSGLNASCPAGSADMQTARRSARRTLAAPAIAWVAFAILAMPCTAQTTYFVETGKTIARLGAQGRGFYVGFVEPLTQSCQYNNIYIASDTKGQYAQLLAAKLSNKRLSRVDYSQPAGPGTQCNSELIEIAD
jgi:hypothetical protein